MGFHNSLGEGMFLPVRLEGELKVWRRVPFLQLKV